MNQEYEQIIALIIVSSISILVGTFFLYRFGNIKPKEGKK